MLDLLHRPPSSRPDPGPASGWEGDASMRAFEWAVSLVALGAAVVLAVLR